MSYGEILIKGRALKNSSYLLIYAIRQWQIRISGPALSIFLSKWLRQNGNNFYSYRFIFILRL